MAPPITRRDLLAGAAGAASMGLLPGCGNGGRDPATLNPGQPLNQTLPSPDELGIDHFVIVMMENRSYDHFLGWVPNSNGIQAGLSYPDKNGNRIETFHLAPHPEYGYQGCGKEDPAHGYGDGRAHFNDGTMDGFLATVGDANVATDHFPLGYYTADDLPFFRGVAEHFTIFDNYYHGYLGSTFPNRVYLHAGQTDRSGNSFDRSSLPTIWDRLAGAGIEGRYYFHDLPLVGLWWEQYLDISYRFEQFQTDAALGQLPAVSMVDPRFLGEAPNGVSNDDHPQADVRNGQAFLDAVYTALRNSPQWERSLMVICYDEWGGFYDHVAPPVGPVTEQEAEFNDGRLGFRVPAALIGPRVRRGHVSSIQFDVNSILNMLCWRFGLEPLGARGDYSLNMALALDLAGEPNLDAPDFGVDPGPHGVDCGTGFPQPLPNQIPISPNTSAGAQEIYDAHNAEWEGLREVARKAGFDV